MATPRLLTESNVLGTRALIAWTRGCAPVLGLALLCSCRIANDAQSLFAPRFQRSEIFGFLAGFGTTFAALPDLLAMLRRKSSAGYGPRMAAITGAFQVLWIYYGLLITSRPVIVWNGLAVLINFLNVAVWAYYRQKGRRAP